MKILSIFGTRPEAIKMAPVIRELKKLGIKPVILATAQHRQLLDEVLKAFNIKSDYDLDIMLANQSLVDISCRSLTRITPILEKEKPDKVVVQGDTTTALFAALAAVYRKIPVAHVEAGLRTQDKYQPFPEELNRRLISKIADYHFAPTKRAVDNLLRENISKDVIYLTGNTGIDALLWMSKQSPAIEQPGLKKILSSSKRIILVTAHRRESFGEPMRNIFLALKVLSKLNNIKIVFPVHLNPNVQRLAKEILAGVKNICLIKPLDYKAFVQLMKVSFVILTDSGGIQEEAPSLKKPVLVLREVTERPEAIEVGAAKLVGTSKDKIVRETLNLLNNQSAYKQMAKGINPFGDGKAAQRIAAVLAGRKFNPFSG
jgi:UDP-N-acetylglucosamine 2-epimerase